MGGLPPIMYRLTDALRVQRVKGVFWTLTFAPILPRSAPDLDARLLIVTVTDARYERLADHGPNFTRGEVEAMEHPRSPRQHKT